MDPEFKKSLRETLAYFDIFDYPLTDRELYQFFWNFKHKISFLEFSKKLKKFVGSECQFKHGYYFLPGREGIIESRRKRVVLVEKKAKIARKAAKIIRWVPFAKAVFLCNTVAFGWPNEDSDVDVFIIIKSGRIWIARFFTTIFLGLFGLRRGKKKVKNKVCLSFYLADKNLNISNISLDEPDIYLMYWIGQLLPIYDPENFHKKIFSQNQWVKKCLPRIFQEFEISDRLKVKDTKFQKGFKKFFEKIWGIGYGDILESQARALQKAKMKRNKTSLQNEEDSRVIINDQMLKFHENDRRDEYRQKWLQNILKYN